MERIYLDHLTTTPPGPDVIRAMLPYLGERFANAASPTRRGAGARAAIDSARGAVARLVHAPPEEIVFISSATEANNLALKGIALAPPARRGRILAAATEHISVLHPSRSLERHGFGLTLLGVGRDGRVDPASLDRAMTEDTILVSIAHASGEIGTLQPIEDLVRIARARGVPFHCDASVTAGLVPWPRSGGPDLVTISSQRLGGPQGVAALRVRKGLRLAPLIEGGTQEGGLRAGTEPVPLVVGFGAAARSALDGMAPPRARLEDWTRRLRRDLESRIAGAVFTGHPTARVPGHLSLCLKGVDSEALLRSLDEEGVEVASGSPCATEAFKTSHVLEAIGIDPVSARGALVLSFGALSREDDPERAAAILSRVVDRLRALSPIGPV